MILALVTALAGGCGALLRLVADGAIENLVRGAFPWGTWSVNVAGSFVLGVLTGMTWYHGLPAHLSPVLGTGLCGGFTTWSTASWETVRLVEGGLYRHAFGFALGGLAAALAAAAAGMAVASL